MGDGSSGRPDTKGKGRATPSDGVLALDLEHAEGGIGVPNGGGNAFQQMELVEQQVHPRLHFCTSLEQIILTGSYRIVTFNRAPPPSSRLRPQLRN